MQIWLEGDTTPRSYTLQTDGEAENLTGATVELILRDVDGNEVTTSGDVTVDADPTTGIVTFAPDEGDLEAASSPYLFLWKVTYLDGSISYFPGGGADSWIVRDPFTPTNVHTFGQLRRKVLRWLDAYDEYATGNNMDEMVKQQLNAANTQRCLECSWDFMKASTTIAVTASTRRIPLPGNCGRLESVWHSVDGYLTYVPKRMQDVYGVTRDWAVSGSFQKTPFEIEGTVIRFLEPPTAGTVYLSYLKAPIPMEQPDDISDLPYPHTELLVWDVLLDLKSYATETEQAALWLQKQQKAEAALYDAHKESQIIGGIVPSIRPGDELR